MPSRDHSTLARRGFSGSGSEHRVHDAVLVRLLGAVAGVEVAGGAFVLEDGGPGRGGGVGGEEGAAGSEGERVHTY
jgi:hypothetical protein